MKEAFAAAGIPVYPSERCRYFPVGGGLADDKLGDDSEQSILLRADETDAGVFGAYLDTLARAGFVRGFYKEDESGVYAEYSRGETLLYAYYILSEACARIVLDRVSAPLAAFCAGPTAAPCRENAQLMQYGLYYDKMIKGVTCDCGMFYAVRLRNNELILVDGGEAEQGTDAAIAEIMARLRALTGTEKITVALWFCSHAHDDHMDVFLKLLRVYGDDITLRQVMFNFPAASQIHFAPYVSRMRARLSAFAKDVPVLKAHAGQTFSLAGATVEVLTTHEDILGDYPDRAYRGMNETTTVLKVSFEGVSVLFLGDAEEHNGDVLNRRYAKDRLACTFLQAAHHCINRVENIYAAVQAEKVLIPEGRALIRTGPEDPYAVICRYNKEENIVCAGDGTAVYTIEDGAYTAETFPVVGGAYDNSGV